MPYREGTPRRARKASVPPVRDGSSAAAAGAWGVSCFAPHRAARLTEASFGGDLAGRSLPDADQAKPGQLKERLWAGPARGRARTSKLMTTGPRRRSRPATAVQAYSKARLGVIFYAKQTSDEPTR